MATTRWHLDQAMAALAQSDATLAACGPIDVTKVELALRLAEVQALQALVHSIAGCSEKGIV